MTDESHKPVHPALSRNDTLYTETLAGRVFESPERFMETWKIAMSVDDNGVAAILLNNLRLRPDYFGPLRKCPRRFGVSAMGFQRELVKSADALRDLVIGTRRQVDSYILKKLARHQTDGDGSQNWAIGQAIATAIAELLSGLASEAGGNIDTGKVTRAVETVADIAVKGAARPSAPDAPALSQLAIDMRKTALSAAHDERFRNMAAPLADIERVREARNVGADVSDVAGKEKSDTTSDDANDAGIAADDLPGPWRAGGRSPVKNRRPVASKPTTAEHGNPASGIEEREQVNVR